MSKKTLVVVSVSILFAACIYLSNMTYKLASENKQLKDNNVVLQDKLNNKAIVEKIVINHDSLQCAK